MENAVARQETGDLDRSALISDWSDSIRAACATLRRASPQGMSSITVTGRLEGPATEALLLKGLSSELAERHGLLATVELADTRFTVRLTRRGVA